MYSIDSSATSYPGTTPRAVHTAKSSCYAGVYSGTSPKPVIADEAETTCSTPAPAPRARRHAAALVKVGKAWCWGASRAAESGQWHGYDEGRWVTGPEEDRDRSGYCRMLRIDVFVDGLGVDVVEGRVRCI